MAASKIKKSIWESAEIWEMIEKHRDKDRHQSIAQFIEEAVRHYCCSSDTEDHKEILTRELMNALRYVIKGSENHIAATLFKMAGEQATLSLIIADQIIKEIDEETMREYRNEAYDIIRKRHGVFTFPDAYENAKELAESGDD